MVKRIPIERSASGKRRPGSARGEIVYVAPDAFKPLDELPIAEIVDGCRTSSAKPKFVGCGARTPGFRPGRS